MRKTRKCAFCGKEFTCNSGSQKYCSEHCAEAAKAQRKKKRKRLGITVFQPRLKVCTFARTNYYEYGKQRQVQESP